MEVHVPRRLGRLATLTITAAVGVLALAQPVGAESTTECYRQVNAYRSQARVPAMTASYMPALARAALNHARYRANSDARRLGEASAHFETPGRPYYTGRYPWDRTAAAGLRKGTWRSQAEDVITGTSVTADQLRGVKAWISAPYHRFPLLDANNRHVGCAAASASYAGRLSSAQVLQMASSSATSRGLTVYPAPDQRGVPTAFNRLSEVPTPFRMASRPEVGYVVSIQAPGYSALRLTSASLSRGSVRVPIYVGLRDGSPTARARWYDSNLPANAAMLASTAPLASGTTYTARFTGSVRVGTTWVAFSRTWSFTTA